MPSFSIPLSGLSADSTALNTIANNLSNMNTTAYKEQHVNFADMLYQSMGSNGAGDPESVGSGVKVSSISTNFSSSASTSTSLSTDMAIDGDGFFVVQNNNGTSYYTRNGNFTTSDTGVLTTQNGEKVMGYPVNSSGAVNTSAALTSITIPVNSVETPTATSNATIQANLDASATTATTSPTASLTIYDSLGGAHTATVTFSKDPSGTNNLWDFTVTMAGSEFTPSSTGAVTLASGTMTFNSSGTLTGAAELTGVTGTASGAASRSLTISTAGHTYANGASVSNVNWDLFNTAGAGEITQVASASSSSGSGSSINSQITDGNSAAKYDHFTVATDGTVSAVYSNNDTRVLGQIAVASITNEQGLQAMGNSLYSTTSASGDAVVGVAGTGGRGGIKDTYLENSNVDISTEFANLIVAQRAFEANAKSVTTFDTISQDTINLIRS